MNLFGFLWALALFAVIYFILPREAAVPLGLLILLGAFLANGQAVSDATGLLKTVYSPAVGG